MIIRAHKITEQEGIAAILTVIIIGISAVIMATSASFLSLGELDMSYVSNKAAESYYITEGCIEETLRRVRLDTGYQASGLILPIGSGSCVINVSADNNERTINVQGNSGNYNKMIEVGLLLSGDVITINTWEEKEN